MRRHGRHGRDITEDPEQDNRMAEREAPGSWQDRRELVFHDTVAPLRPGDRQDEAPPGCAAARRQDDPAARAASTCMKTDLAADI